MMLGLLHALVVEPDPQADKVVVLMHGYGAPGDDLVGLADYLPKKGYRYVFAEAPLDLGGGRAWWHIDWNERAQFERKGDWQGYIRVVPPGLSEAVRAIDTLVDAVEAKYKPKALVLGGFSQGAMMAVHVAAHRVKKPVALVLLSGAAMGWPRWEKEAASLKGLPVFQSHGTQDVVLPLVLGEDLRDRLGKAGARIGWLTFNAGHAIPGPVLSELSRFLGAL